MKHSFFNRQDTAITLLFGPGSIAEAIAGARSAEMDGADGIAVELKRIPLEERTEENFRKLIGSVQLPFMFTDYRKDLFLGADDDERGAGALPGGSYYVSQNRFFEFIFAGGRGDCGVY